MRSPVEAEAIAYAAIARRVRCKNNEARVKAGEKLGNINTKMTLHALKAQG